MNKPSLFVFFVCLSVSIIFCACVFFVFVFCVFFVERGLVGERERELERLFGFGVKF